MAQHSPAGGKVSLVGAGPGDPGLLTLRGLECLRSAEVIVYDRLIGPEILSHARPGAELIYCGKSPGQQAMTQDQINALLVDRARAGKVVCRLKGGDPFVFGRGGEEALALVEHGIEFEVVPGVSSAIAAGAYAGIPVTHRGLATSFTVATGHEDPGKPDRQVDWRSLARAGDTLVVLMGVGQLEQIVAQLLAAGRPPDTPAALVSWATLPQQRTLRSTLQAVAAEARAYNVRPPAVLIVGDVVRLWEKLSWFETRPLHGRRILVTRTREQASELSELLRRQGAIPTEMPVIQLIPPDTWEPFDQAVAQAERYDWLVFTSANGVRFTMARLQELGLDVRALKGPRVAAIGPRTVAAAQDAGMRVSLCPEKYVAESLAEAMTAQGLSGRRILLLRAAEGRETLPEAAQAQGAQVDVVAVYRTVPAERPDPGVLELLDSGGLDAITFTSSSSVRNFLGLIGPQRAQMLARGITIACIGPVTRDAARQAGLPVAVMPQEHTIKALVEALVEHFTCGAGSAGSATPGASAPDGGQEP